MSAPVKTHKANKIVGKTSPEFTGVTVPTLRTWLKYWSSDKAKGNKAITADRPIATHIALIQAELDARGIKA